MIKRTNIDAFEKLVLIVGIMAIFVGGVMINGTLIRYNYELTWEFLQTTFIWLIMVIFLILLALSEDMKLSILQSQQIQMDNLIEEVKKLNSNIKKK